MAIIGIDLGTTNSCMAVYRDEQAEIITNHIHERTTPSVFQVKPNGEEIIGKVAKQNAATYHDSTVLEVKRLMGTDKVVHVQDKQYRPEEISAKIIRYLKLNAEKYLNSNVVEAVITVPAYFTDAQRKATKDAGELAGLKVERIINEPTAAALAFCHDHLDEDRNLLVYDLGGGTFDVSIVEVFEGIIEVKSSVGNNTLGGIDFDNEIIQLIKDDFLQQNGYAMESIAPNADMFHYTLKGIAETTKIALSTQVESDILIPFVGLKDNLPVSFQCTLRRDAFERSIDTYVKDTIDKVKQCLQEANLTENDISEVLMVGGSTRVPYIQEEVKRIFGSKIRTEVNPDEVVAQGAAVQAALKSGGMSGDKSEMVAIDVCPYTLGTSVGHDNRFDPFIKKNTPIPYQVTKSYNTLNSRQTDMLFEVYQGENQYVRDNTLVSDDFVIRGIPSGPAGQESVDVVIGYDINGLIELEVVIVSTGEKLHHFVQTQAGIMDSQSKSQAILRMDEEEEKSMLIENLKQAIYRAEKMKDKADEKDKKRLDTLIERGKYALETGEERQIRAADQQLLDLILSLI